MGRPTQRPTQRPIKRPAGWGNYYAGTAGRPPRRTVLAALEQLAPAPKDDTRRAIDLGCGGGRDTAPLLSAGLEVLAVDRAADAEQALRERFPDALASGQLIFRQQDFSTDPLNLPAAHLVNASFCLPTCPPDRFPGLWSQIARALIPGGLFAGHLYGPQDSWAKRGDNLTIHRRADVEALFDGWDLLLCDEEETDSVTPRGTEKHWHVFHIVARKTS